MSTLELLPRPKDAAPWRIRSTSVLVKISLASTLPTIAAILIGNAFEIPGPITLLVVFLPLQLLASGLAALSTRGKRGVADAQLNVAVLFATTFVAIMLGSVLYSVVSFGLNAISPHFAYQNNVYVTSTTSLEYGGAGHALLGTVLVVGLAALIAVPIGISWTRSILCPIHEWSAFDRCGTIHLCGLRFNWFITPGWLAGVFGVSSVDASNRDSNE